MIGVCRHRLSIDGKGVTTLVAFHGCPLQCRYCLNKECLHSDGIWKEITAEQLLKEVEIDNLYFLATGGGITFGGGEPLLRSRFIEEFCRKMKASWNITMETALNVEREHLERVFPFVNEYIVDIKDMNPDIYRRYTTRDNHQAVGNLHWLLQHEHLNERIIVRLPRIPGYNTNEDIEKSRQQLEAMGITRFDLFDYIKGG